MSIGMPLLGWMLLSASGATLHVFAWELVPIVAHDEVLAEALEERHELGAQLAYVLFGLHVCGALYHHLVRRDDTLKRMLPRR
jgi:cytochrome b561